MGALLFAVAFPVMAAPSAGAQEGCQTTATTAYPPSNGGGQLEALVLQGGHVPPGQNVGTVTITNARPGFTYCGVMFSTEFSLPNKTADAQGRLVYQGLAIPADFELNAAHHINVFRSGSLVGSFDFCVNGNADIVALKSTTCAKANANANANANGNRGNSGNLARTGFDQFWEILRVALVAFALGALALYARRRVVANRPLAP